MNEVQRRLEEASQSHQRAAEARLRAALKPLAPNPSVGREFAAAPDTPSAPKKPLTVEQAARAAEPQEQRQTDRALRRYGR